MHIKIKINTEDMTCLRQFVDSEAENDNPDTMIVRDVIQRILISANNKAVRLKGEIPVYIQ